MRSNLVRIDDDDENKNKNKNKNKKRNSRGGRNRISAIKRPTNG